MLDGLVGLLVDFFNLLIRAIGALISLLVGILPDSPFLLINELFEDIPFISNINWVIPFGTFLYIAILWGVAIGVYYIVSIALRFVKMIE